MRKISCKAHAGFWYKSVETYKQVAHMRVSYKKVWKLFIGRDMKKKDL
jgi:hypothetical protein